MDCIRTGILTQACRNEIIQTLIALIWTQTHRPTSVAYNTVCRRLIEVHPSLADDDEPKHVCETYYTVSTDHFSCIYFPQFSWKRKLRDRFKFLRRPPISPKQSGPAPKRHKGPQPVHTAVVIGEQTEEDHDADVKMMKTEMSKKKNIGELCAVMKRTFSNRAQWIQSNEPPVQDVLEMYPALCSPKVVSILVHILCVCAFIHDCTFCVIAETGVLHTCKA